MICQIILCTHFIAIIAKSHAENPYYTNMITRNNDVNLCDNNFTIVTIDIR